MRISSLAGMNSVREYQRETMSLGQPAPFCLEAEKRSQALVEAQRLVGCLLGAPAVHLVRERRIGAQPVQHSLHPFLQVRDGGGFPDFIAVTQKINRAGVRKHRNLSVCSIRQLDCGEFLQCADVSRRFHFQPDAGSFRVLRGFTHRFDHTLGQFALARRFHGFAAENEERCEAALGWRESDDGPLFSFRAQRPTPFG